MDKRYQVFISSTFEDLQEERSEVMQALLELDCIPAGMELFPASNEDQWSLIKRVIDDCDYYILIIGGRYGSCNNEGISYTEQEFRYAIETNKPIISFLHKTPGDISNNKSEQDPDKKIKLSKFRNLAQKKMIKYWSSPQELGSVVSRSMIKLMKQFPAFGWVKANDNIDIISTKEILRLRSQIEGLEQNLKQQANTAPSGSEHLAKGEESFNLKMQFKGKKTSETYTNTYTFKLSWNEIFIAISPYIVGEGTEKIMIQALINQIKTVHAELLQEIKQSNNYKSLSDYVLDSSEFQTIKIQLKALGLIQQSNKNRSVKDNQSYWTLTPYGDHIMTQLIALPSLS